MKLAITAQGQDTASSTDPRFGRCQYFIIADTDRDSFEAVSNENLNASGGAGIAAAQMLVNRGVEAVITGNLGPNAMRVLQAAGITVYSTNATTVKEALQQWRAEVLSPINQSTVAPHHGMGKSKGGNF